MVSQTLARAQSLRDSVHSNFQMYTLNVNLCIYDGSVGSLESVSFASFAMFVVIELTTLVASSWRLNQRKMTIWRTKFGGFSCEQLATKSVKDNHLASKIWWIQSRAVAD